MDPEATSKLQTVWMKIYGVSAFAKIEDVVKEVASLVAEPIVVDKVSLIKTGPVRVKVRCRDPAQLRGFVEIFFNRVGYEVRFVVEGFKGKYSSKGDGPYGNGKHDKDKKDDKDKMEVMRTLIMGVIMEMTQKQSGRNIRSWKQTRSRLISTNMIPLKRNVNNLTKYCP